jgi:hypothetical protein
MQNLFVDHKPAMNGWETIQRICSAWFFVFVSLATLVTLVVAQALYEMLAHNQFFLTSWQVSNRQLLEIILVFNCVPALALFLLWVLFWWLNAGLARAFLMVVYFGLFVCFFFQIHAAYLDGWQLFPHFYLIWIIPAAAWAVAVMRFEKAFRAFVLVLTPVILLFPGLFLLRTWNEGQNFVGKSSVETQAVMFAQEQQGFPPLFMLVLDELSIQVLLDETGQIDGRSFPHFRELAGQSYWFRNATANASGTHHSIPTILTGNFPRSGDPVYGVYPDNLLGLLQSYYDIYVYESWTRFCVPERFHCLPATLQRPDRQVGFFRELSYFYAKRILPSEFVSFIRKTGGSLQTTEEHIKVRLARFEKFLETISSLGNQGGIFFFFHHLLPHSPYVLTRDGGILNTPPYSFDDTADDSCLFREIVERYRRQVMYVDNELGRLVAQLKRVGLYEKSLLIVTADHGVSYRFEAPGREFKEVEGVFVNADLILTVPLFIKVPFQKEGFTSDRDVQLIDLVPTVAEVQGLDVPWPVAGRSIFASEEETRAKIVYYSAEGRLEFPDDLGIVRVRENAEGSSEEQACP